MNLQYFAAALPAIVIALALHEFGHAAMATKMGDPTPRMQGRLTLNPLAHLDPMGTIFIIMTLMAGFGFGWGKPVQTNPAYYKDYKQGRILVAVAGPAMNLAQAMLIIALTYLLFLAKLPLGTFGHLFVQTFLIINIVLMMFNLIPIPPLDGGHVMEMMLPYQYRDKFRSMGRYGLLIVLAILWLTPLFGWMIRGTLTGIAMVVQAGFGEEFLMYLFGM